MGRCRSMPLCGSYSALRGQDSRHYSTQSGPNQLASVKAAGASCCELSPIFPCEPGQNYSKNAS